MNKVDKMLGAIQKSIIIIKKNMATKDDLKRLEPKVIERLPLFLKD